MNAKLLLKVKRSNLTEREHYGYVTIVSREKVLASVGDHNADFFLRSCAKPFQALPIITSGAFSKFNFTLEELAVCCASHTASKEHVNLIESILHKTGLCEENLRCGIHDPIDQEMRNSLIRSNLPPRHVHNNCSGKHAGMLSTCLAKGYELKDYLDFDHPLQIEIRETIKNFCKTDKLESSLDGCSAPVYGMPLYRMGIGILNLFLDNKAKPMKLAFMRHPTVIGGLNRIDSEIMRVTNGRLVSKLGAEGLCIVVNPDKKQALVVKILDSNVNARAIVTIEALKQLEWINEESLNSDGLKKLYDLRILTLNQTLVGEVEPVFKI